jgi:hypothetical protein
MPNLPISLLPELTAITSNAEFVVEQSGTTYKVKNFLFETTYLPVSGGTINGDLSVTGDTSVQSLTATTISATTYQNLPEDIYVTGGTYNNGDATFTNNSGGTFTVTGFPIGSGGGQTFYLNISESISSNRYLSTSASTASEQTLGTPFSSGLTSSIASFQSDQLGVTLIPGGIWSFYLHSYKQTLNASFNIFVDVYKLTSGGTSTLLFSTDPVAVTSNSPTPSMQLTDAYFSGCPLSITDSIVADVRATNTSDQTYTITLVSEGSQYYSYAISTLPTQQGLTCDTLSGCSVIQTIQTNVSNKFDKSGGTINGNLSVTGDTSVQSLSATTISATTYQNLPATPFLPLSGGTVTGATNFTGGLSATTISANTIVISGITVNPIQTIALFFGHDSLSPGDTQTYYIGNAINLTAPISGSDGRRVIMPKTGNIVAVDICQNTGGTLGSSEGSTFTVNNVTQSTQSTITTSYVYTASSANILYTLSSPLSVTAGDKIEIRWTTPAWVTNPTTIRQQMNVYLEY